MDLRHFILNVPQIVPESWCSECRICCRFPATENVQTPFWSPLEAEWAEKSAPEGRPWLQREEASPSLSPRLVSCGTAGYRCPAFEPQTNRCRIHAVKPLDCRLYPFVLARNPGGTEVLLAMDPKCPYIERNTEDPKLHAYAARLAGYLDTEVGMEYLRQNPNVAGPSWPEYLWVAGLPRATSWIQKRPEAGPPPHPALRPVAETDLPALREALGSAGRRASHYALASHLGWSDLMALWWAPLRSGPALFAEQAQGFFMPVPPSGDSRREETLRQAWGILTEANRDSGVSRIEGIEASDAPLFEGLGFTLRPAEDEYLYEVSSLAQLKGDRYRSQRWAVNRCARSIPFQVRPFEGRDLVPCLQIYTRWAIRRQKQASGDLERRLLRDSLFFHRRLMMDGDRLGLLGRVLESEGKVLAYTFGGAVSGETFCLFAEIAGRDVPGLAQTLCREFCREIERSGYRWVNAMGDSGLDSLRRAKTAYRPEEMIRLFTATMK